MSEPIPFDVCGPLPEGTTLLEASAGTGKTATIAALATRYVAEGVADLSRVMLVTFSRAATQELRERVRERLVGTAAGLADPVRARDSDDDVLRLLAGGSADEVERRRRRLVGALSDFDAATIATTHGFSQQMLAGLGMAGDSDPDATFVESTDDLVREVVDDLYLRKYAPAGSDPPAMEHPTARRVAREAMQDAQARLLPDDAAPGTEAQERYGIARAVRVEVDARKRARRLLDYDDLLTRLRDALLDDERGPAARERIRARYSVVLVDEFQDTDPVQWDILRAAFHGSTTLVLIGDPKQAVYAFRGADLVTYLRASAAAGTRRTLGRNWRSDPGVVAAIDAVFGGVALGDPEVVVRPVAAARSLPRLTGAPSGASMRLRRVRRPPSGGKHAPVSELRPEVAADLADDVVALLTARATLMTQSDARVLGPGDVAVLVRTNRQAVLVREALDRVRVPAVLAGTRSVFATEPAREWLVLLRAVEQPHRAGLVRAAALTCFVGWSAAELAAAEDAGLDDLGTRLRAWRDVLADRGVAALLQIVSASERLPERLLARMTGERDLTDLRHVGEALHAAAVRGQLGPTSLVEWLSRRIAEAQEDTLDERSRRLESDKDAVQVVTIHGAKGLQFPVVYVPFGWNRHKAKDPGSLRLHGSDGERLLDVGGPRGPGHAERTALHWAEDDGEELRLLYVATTRAQCQVVAWWAPSANTSTSALHRLLFGDADLDGLPPADVTVPSDTSAARRLQALADRCGSISAEVVGEPRGLPWSSAAEPAGALAAGRFTRRLDTAWRRASYTSLTAGLHTAPVLDGVASEPEVPERQDEPELPAPADGDEQVDGGERVGGGVALSAVSLPLAGFPGGTAFGTLVHAVLEEVDTSAPDLAADLLRRTTDAVGWRASSVDPAALAEALLPVLETPLGPLAHERSLRDVPPGDRLAELDFELPLAGGDSPSSAGADLRAFADVVRRHLSATDPLAALPDLLTSPALQAERLRGYLTGSIDAVLRLRLRGAGGAPRYLVVDYKTNRLGTSEPLTAWDYRPAALTESMLQAGYPLQALLYSVALHRFLRWRQPSYDPALHLGGVLYLYVRGMAGPSTPRVDGAPCGVFSWQPPAELVVELSSLLDRSGS